MKLRVRGAIVAALLAVSPIASAQAEAPTVEQVKKAGEEFELGRRAFKAGDWVEAAEHFEAADRNAPNKKVLENAIRSREKAGQLDRAATLAALALERHPKDADLVKLSKPLVEQGNSELYRVSVECNTACELLIDSKIVHGDPAVKRTVYLNPGSYELRAGWSGGRVVSKPVTAAKGKQGAVSFEEPPKPVEPSKSDGPVAPIKPTPDPGKGPEPDSTGGGWSPAVFWVGAGLTAVAGGITIWSGIDTQNNPGADTVRAKCVGQGDSCPEYQDGLDRQKRTNILAGVTAGLGVITILIGTVATDWGGGDSSTGHAKKSSTARRGVEPFVGLGQGASLGARGRF